MDVYDLLFAKCVALNCKAEATHYEKDCPSICWCWLHRGIDDIAIVAGDTRLGEVFDYCFYQPSNPKLIVRSVDQVNINDQHIWASCAYCRLERLDQQPLVKRYVFDAHQCRLPSGEPYYHRGYFCADEVECRLRASTTEIGIEHQRKVKEHRRKKLNEKYPVDLLKELIDSDIKIELLRKQLRES